MMNSKDFLAPLGLNCSSCGYCHSGHSTSKSFGAWAYTLTPKTYEAMLCTGWRRSGSFLYKPLNRETCCPQYAIRLYPCQFKPSKQHRQVVNKFNRFLKEEWMCSIETKDPIILEDSSEPLPERKYVCCCDFLGSFHQGCPFETEEAMPSLETSRNAPFHLRTAFKETHHSFKNKKKLKIILESASATLPKFRLYKKYQTHVHGDSPSQLTMKSFTNFLVTSPFTRSSSSSLYGTYHLLYVLDTTLVAISVLDLLPTCVSSVYFFYDPEYAFLQLGKWSVLYELTWTFHAFGSSSITYNLGYFVPNCTKMEYKAQFQPSQLLHPLRWTWVPFQEPRILFACPASWNVGEDQRCIQNENEEFSKIWVYDGHALECLENCKSNSLITLIRDMILMLDPETARTIVYVATHTEDE